MQYTSYGLLPPDNKMNRWSRYWRLFRPGILETGSAGAAEDDDADRTAWVTAALGAAKRLQARHPVEIRAVLSELEAYAEAVEALGLKGAALPATYPVRAMALYALREGLPLLFGLPLAALGLLLHGLPYLALRFALALANPQGAMKSSYTLAGGVLFFSIGWALEAWLAAHIGGWLAFLAFAIALAPAGFFAIGWRERLVRVRRDARGLLTFLLQRDLHASLRRRRDALRERLDELARR